MLEQHPDTDVVNLSLGTDATYTATCDNADATTLLLADAVNQLRAAGAVVVAATGNQGLSNATQAPACLANVLSIGAVWDAPLGSQTALGCTENTAADKPTCFSNSSATTDLFAPGAPTTATGIAGGSATFHGTSQATALTSGCAALLREFAPAAPPSALEAALRTSTKQITVPASGRSFPRLDCDRALAALGGAIPALPRAALVVAGGLCGLAALAAAWRMRARGAARTLH